jgi:hypothetical protein
MKTKAEVEKAEMDKINAAARNQGGGGYQDNRGGQGNRDSRPA